MDDETYQKARQLRQRMANLREELFSLEDVYSRLLYLGVSNEIVERQKEEVRAWRSDELSQLEKEYKEL